MLTIKTRKDRVVEAIDYLGQLNSHLGSELYRAIRNNRRIDIGAEISLGRSDSAINEDTRVALRALLLCQAYYFGRRNRLHWKETSLNFWKTKDKTAINRAILLFTAPCNSASRLAGVSEAAGVAPYGGRDMINYKLSRAEPFHLGSGTCFVAIMVWMLQCGIVSYQWYIRHSMLVNDPAVRLARLKASFGTRTHQLWGGGVEMPPNHILPLVARGHIVHLYLPNGATLGHWMISRGNGLYVGCNNHLDGAAARMYSTIATVEDQFISGYNEQHNYGVIDVYDPVRVPDRELLYV